MAPGLFRISILASKRAELIHNTIDSALAQTDTNSELLIVDDGSSDSTEAVRHFYAEKHVPAKGSRTEQ